MKYQEVIGQLLDSAEPSIRWKTRVNVLEEASDLPELIRLQEQIRNSDRVRKLLQRVNESGLTSGTTSVYAKWQGTHWIMNTLADIGYPYDPALIPLRDRVLNEWLSGFFYKEFVATARANAYAKEGVPILEGRYRRCASQQGNALFFILQLQLANDRIHQLVERLLHWQWPDGGWNCDKEPSAHTSTFVHTLWSVRGLARYTKQFDDEPVIQAVRKAAEVLLSRKLYKSSRTGAVVKEEFTQLHYPQYWHYDILASLKVMAEAGFIADPRCNDALDLLEKKFLPSGGWPSEKKYYTVSDKVKLGNDFVDWGPTGKRKANEWTTVDALFVLKKAGRL